MPKQRRSKATKDPAYRYTVAKNRRPKAETRGTDDEDSQRTEHKEQKMNRLNVAKEGKKKKRGVGKAKSAKEGYILNRTNPPEIQQMLIEEPYEPINFPSESRFTAVRWMLEIKNKPSNDVYDGEFRNLEKCVFCYNAKNKDGDKNLLFCEGMMNGLSTEKGKNTKCQSVFHLSCAKNYRAHGFDFHYSALPDHQNKLLCPLHNCSLCNKEGHKERAHEGVLVECVYCLRAFHSDTCLPFGGAKIQVNVKGSQVKKLGMISCPFEPVTDLDQEAIREKMLQQVEELNAKEPWSENNDSFLKKIRDHPDPQAFRHEIWTFGMKNRKDE